MKGEERGRKGNTSASTKSRNKNRNKDSHSAQKKEIQDREKSERATRKNITCGDCSTSRALTIPLMSLRSVNGSVHIYIYIYIAIRRYTKLSGGGTLRICVCV
jgi:hypothetical protein